MSTATEPPQVEVHDVRIDHVSVGEPKKSDVVKNLLELTPLIGLVFSFALNGVQYYQAGRQREDTNRQVEQAKKDDRIKYEETKVEKVASDWREALKNIDAHSSALLALEMETFAAEEKYGKKAKSLVYPTLLKIEDDQFDAVLNSLLDNVKEDDQQDFIRIVHDLTIDLQMHYYDKARAARKKRGAGDLTLESFVASPESYIPDGPDRAKVESLTYKLDTVSAGLRKLWNGGPGRMAVKPGKIDLSGLIFLNLDYRDFSGVDFSASSMKDSYFIGKCNIDAGKLPAGIEAPIVSCVKN